ncbi:MAG: penicillin-binding protein 2 [Flavipsychrobacter sp.]
MSLADKPRMWVITSLFTLVALVIVGRLFYIQIVDDKYKVMANNIAIYKKIVYPPRGVIYDKNHKVMLYNQVVYDLMATYSKVPKTLDTMKLCGILGIDKARFEELLDRTRVRYGPVRKGIMVEQLTKAQTARLQENMYAFDGFEMSERYIRTYPDSTSALILGYIGEISPRMLKNERYVSYQRGDYIGINGLEHEYEEELRGQRGVYFFERDNYNRPTEPYKKGALDTQAIAGSSLELSLDVELQAYGERLMSHKIGSVVAINPKTGGILALVSAPSYNPNLLGGRERAKNFSRLYYDATKPLFNRATQAYYQPGSTIKPLTALVALDIGVITPNFGYPCAGGYYSCGKRIGCTHTGGGHAANLRRALANSCNAYFVHILRLAIDSKKFGGVKKGLQKWYEYYNDFGFGRQLGVDLPYERKGLLPDSSYYNRAYNGRWNSCMVLFTGMGQGEIALTPLQLANAMCIIANKGYYYTPHFVRSINGNADHPKLKAYKEKHVVTSMPQEVYDVVALGMQDVVEFGTGKVAQLPNVDVCAKTGTVENKARIGTKVIKMKDHSVFVAFAPREDPKIALAAVVENAGFGATWAGPVVSLMMEKYLNDTIATGRLYLEDKLYKANLINEHIYEIDASQREADRVREERRLERLRVRDSANSVRDSLMIRKWYMSTYIKGAK